MKPFHSAIGLRSEAPITQLTTARDTHGLRRSQRHSRPRRAELQLTLILGATVSATQDGSLLRPPRPLSRRLWVSQSSHQASSLCE